MNISVVDSQNVLFKVGDIRYVARNTDDLIQLPFPRPPESILLVTIIQCEETSPIGGDWLENYLKDAEKHDDVFCPAFIQGLLIISGSNLDSNASTRTQCTQQARTYLESIGNKWLRISSPFKLPKGVNPGVYYLSDQKLKPVFRLYDDVNKAFLTTLEPRSRAR